jgi:nitrogen fixation NifU-like protein
MNAHQNDAELQEKFGQEFYERWQNLRYMGCIDNPSMVAESVADCGDRIKIFLDIQDDTITKATFQATGCAPSMVCGSIACELALGKDIQAARQLNVDDILQILPALPDENKH